MQVSAPITLWQVIREPADAVLSAYLYHTQASIGVLCWGMQAALGYGGAWTAATVHFPQSEAHAHCALACSLHAARLPAAPPTVACARGLAGRENDGGVGPLAGEGQPARCEAVEAICTRRPACRVQEMVVLQTGLRELRQGRAQLAMAGCNAAL